MQKGLYLSSQLLNVLKQTFFSSWFLWLQEEYFIVAAKKELTTIIRARLENWHLCPKEYLWGRGPIILLASLQAMAFLSYG